MLAVIIINYKNEERTINYVRDELGKIRISHVIIIVNNEATFKSNKVLEKELQAQLITDISISAVSHSVFIISQSENLGFAKGNNLGAQFAIKHFKISYILFTNNDIRFINRNVVESLIHKLDSLSNEVALIGPKVIGLDGLNQSPEPYISFWNRYIWIYWMTPFLSTYRKNKLFSLDYAQKATEGFHYKVMGSFFIVKKRDFEMCNMMDPNTFLFGEEVILSERLKAIRKKVYYFPDVAVLHEHSQTISNHLDAKKRFETQFSNECYYYSTYKKTSRLSILIGKISVNCYTMIKKK